MSTEFAEAAMLETVSTSGTGQEVRRTTWKPLVQFWSLIAMICLFFGYGVGVLYGIGLGRPGSMESPVSLALLAFFATSLPGCVYFAWREHRNLKRRSR